MTTAVLPPRNEGETLQQYQTRMMESADHHWRCLTVTRAGSLCTRQQHSCSQHRGMQP